MMGTGSADQIISLTAGVIHWLGAWSCQAFLLLGLAWVGLKLDRSRSATTRYRIWLITLLAIAALPLLGALSQKLRLPGAMTPFPVGDIGVIAVPVAVPQTAQPAFSWPSIIWPALFVLWVAGVMILLLRLGNSFWKLHLIKSRARAVSLKDLDCSYSDLLHSYVQRPAFGHAGGVYSLFKLEEGGATATRVQVKFGKAAVTVIEILEGLNVGDKVIISDMSGYAGVNTIKLN